MKYQKKGLQKALSMLLTVLMIMTMLPIMASAESAPAFEEGYPKIGAVQADGSKKIEVLAKCSFPEGVEGTGIDYVLLAKDDPAPTKEQIKSTRGYMPGVTVITWGHILNSGDKQPIWINGAQDNTEYEFYIVCSNENAISEVEHLDVTTPAAASGDPGTPVLASPTGLQWDPSGGIKAKWNAVDHAASYVVTFRKEGWSTPVTWYENLKDTEVIAPHPIVGYTGNYYFTVQAIAGDGYTSSLKPASQILEVLPKCIIPDCTDSPGVGVFTETTTIEDEVYYHISSPAQLAHINEHLGLNYIQTADIDLSKYNGGEWSPIGGQFGEGSFSGRYLGNGKKITGLTIDIEGGDRPFLYGGLFGQTDTFAHIEGIDLTIKDMSASSVSSGIIYLGGIAGMYQPEQYKTAM